MTKYAITLLGALICSQASAQHIVESYRVVNKPHKHRTVTRTVAPAYYSPAYHAPVRQKYVPQKYSYSSPGVKVRSKVNKHGEVRIREVYQQPWGGKETYTYKSRPVHPREASRANLPVVYYQF